MHYCLLCMWPPQARVPKAATTLLVLPRVVGGRRVVEYVQQQQQQQQAEVVPDNPEPPARCGHLASCLDLGVGVL